ncbi:hypothetical protein GY12_07310, partial [Micrococcus luteus]
MAAPRSTSATIGRSAGDPVQVPHARPGERQPRQQVVVLQGCRGVRPLLRQAPPEHPHPRAVGQLPPVRLRRRHLGAEPHVDPELLPALPQQRLL